MERLLYDMCMFSLCKLECVCVCRQGVSVAVG